ncbi:MAG TPA: DUF4157 domain-containing protein [Longimicrobiales bacterium]|nr:DUF4157 domain-containing protein [Longimicrobiales bacterium]
MIGIVDGVARLAGRGAVASPVTLPDRVALRSSRLIPVLGGFLSGMGRPAAAVTLGRTILVYPGAVVSARLVRHELAHVAQWERQPFTFPIRYIRSHIRHGYRDNPYEREARSAEAGPATTGGTK